MSSLKRRFKDNEGDSAIIENINVIEQKRKKFQARKRYKEETIESVVKKYDSLNNVG